MRVTLLNPPYSIDIVREGRCQHPAAIWSTVYPPLALTTIAANLRKDNEIQLIDAIGEKIGFVQVRERIKSFQPELLIASTSTPTIDSDLQLLRHLKEETGTSIATFGVHATYFAKEIVKQEIVDVVIHNDPENAAHDLTTKEWEIIPGITFQKNNTIITNPSNDLPDLKQLPFPAWDLVKLENYLLPIKKKPYVLVSTGRGCPFGCSFCVAPFYFGKTLRLRPLDQVISELKFVKQFTSDIFFFTETFTLERQYLISLCQEMLKAELDLHWFCNSRVDTIDQEMIRVMRKAGCWMISFGLESGSQAVLDRAAKGIKMSQVIKAVELARDEGLLVAGHFILGLPGENEQSIKETISWAKELPLTFAEFYIATPYPGSYLYEMFKDNLDHNWSAYNCATSIYPNINTLERYQKMAYLKFYLRPKQIAHIIYQFGLRNIPQLTLTGMKFIISNIKKAG